MAGTVNNFLPEKRRVDENFRHEKSAPAIISKRVLIKIILYTIIFSMKFTPVKSIHNCQYTSFSERDGYASLVLFFF